MKTRRYLYVVLPLAVAGLSSCSGEPFSSSDFIAKLFPNGYWDFLIQLVAFILLLIIVFFLGYKPLKKMVQRRKDAVNGMIEEAKQDRIVAKKAAMEADATREKGREDAEEILAKARAQAEFEREKLLAETAEEIARKRKRAEEDIEAARIASREEVKREIVDVAILASETLLGREVDDKDNRRLVSSFVDDVIGEEGDR